MVKIRGTKGLYITKELEVIDKLGKDIYKVLDDTIELEMYGYDIELNKEFLYNVSQLDLDAYMKTHNIFSFKFIENTRKYKGIEKVVKIPILEKPAEVIIDNIVFRVISILPRYAISISAKVIDLKNMCHIPITNHYNKDSNSSYPVVQLTGNDGYRTSRGVHRLMGYAWLSNDDWINNKIVNHIDGDKNNYAIDNLEWCSSVDNNNHAIANGLRYDNYGIKIRNIDTGEITTHPSLTQATKYMGRSNLYVTHTNPIGSGKIISGTNGRYELKYTNDTTEWISVGKPYKIITNGQKLRFNVFLNNEIHTCNNADDINKLVKRFFPDANNEDFITNGEFSNGIRKFQRTFKNIPNDVVHIHNNIDKTYICLNLESNKKIKASDRKEAMNITGGSKSTIQKSISTNGAYSINEKWCVKVDDGKPFAELADISNKRLSVTLTNNNESKTYSSLREAGKFLNVDKKAIKNMLQNKTHINGYYASYAT